MFERFSETSRRVLVLAQDEARQLNHEVIGPEHLLLGLAHLESGATRGVLRSLGLTLGELRFEVAAASAPNGDGVADGGAPPFTAATKKVLEFSLREALRLDHDGITPEHLLLALLRVGDAVSTAVLLRTVGDLDLVSQAVMDELEGRARGGSDPAHGSGRSSLSPSGLPTRPTAAGARFGSFLARPGWRAALEVAGRGAQEYALGFELLEKWLLDHGVELADLSPDDLQILPVQCQDDVPGFQIHVRERCVGPAAPPYA
jgi:ATP-dependent Clp protease ATP-binding subunit ClpC